MQFVGAVVILLIDNVTELLVDGELGNMSVPVQMPDLVFSPRTNGNTWSQVEAGKTPQDV